MECKFTLHVPSMWRQAIVPPAREHPHFAQYIRIESLPVSRTGVLDKRYREIAPDSPDHINVLMLPVAHCALNIKDYELTVVGPAIATRNDIFVFRSRHNMKSMGGFFVVGTKEIDLTTSNIFRVVIANWPADMLFYSHPETLSQEMRECGDRVRAHLMNSLKCEAEYSPSKRLESLLDGRFHAAVFMGQELKVRRSSRSEKESLFAKDDVIDVLNLNRSINSLYHVRALPRAVLCVRRKSSINRDKLDAFVNIYNDAIVSDSNLRDEEVGSDNSAEVSQHITLFVGPKAKKAEIETLIRFTNDMHADEVFKWRRHDIVDAKRAKELSASRSLLRTDFAYWNHTYRAQYEAAVVEHLINLFNRLPKIERQKPDNQAFVNVVRVKLQELPEVPHAPRDLGQWLKKLSPSSDAFSLNDLVRVATYAAEAVNTHAIG